MVISRRGLLLGATALPLAWAASARAVDEPIVIGVSGPLTGPNAQYGAQWKDGFELAFDEVGRTLNGRPVVLQFEDSQSDPRQAVAIAQKFVADPRIVIELGDFSSTASMAASPIYQRARLVQFGFTNSHPDFTKGGDYMWSNSVSQADEQPLLASYAVKDLGFKRLAILHLNTDWGRTSKDLFARAAEADGAAIVATEGYLADEKDFRPTLVRLRDAKPDALILVSYYADAALIARQVRQQGMSQPMVAVSSVFSPKLIELGGDAVEGLYTQSSFAASDPRPEVQKFTAAFRAKYGRDPDSFNVYGYDTIILVHALMEQFGTTRQDLHDGLAKIKDVPSVIFGRASFDPATRRVNNPHYTHLMVKGGRFVVFDPAAKPA